MQTARKSSAKRLDLKDVHVPSTTVNPQAALFLPSAPILVDEQLDTHANTSSDSSDLPEMPDIGVQSNASSPSSGSSALLVSELTVASPPMSTSSFSPSVVPSTLASSLAVVEATSQLNTTLGTLNVTPVPEQGGNRKYVVKKTYQKANLSLKSKFEAVTKNQFAISPDQKHKSCFFCNTLLDELAIRFPSLTLKEEKYKLLTCVPKRFNINDLKERFPTTLYMIRNASIQRGSEGAFSAPTYHYGHPLSADVVIKVKEFYLSSNNSQPSPRLNDTIFIRNEDGQRKEVAKHRILCNLSEMYETFKEVNPNLKVSESKFAALRPKNCVWPGRRGFHNTCLCEIHQNFELMLQALETEETVETFLQKVVCTNPNPECYIGLCSECPKSGFIQSLYLKITDEDEVEYRQWQHTTSTDINKVVKSVNQFMEDFEAYIPKIIEHNYVFRRQQSFITQLRDRKLKEENAISLQVDFAQNYTFLIQNAVQGYHWSNRQATVHPFVLHWWCSKTNKVLFHTYCVISNEMAHDAETFHAFRADVMARILDEFAFLNIRKIYYISDGAAGQYKNYKNLANLSFHLEDFGIPAEWHFTATAHGKSTCDAISGVVKSVTRNESLKPGRFITSPEEMYSFCSQKLTSSTLSIMYIDKTAVANHRASLAQRFVRYKTIPGTRRYHMFSPEGNIMVMKTTSSSETSVRYNFLLGESTRFTFESLNVGSFYSFFASSNYHVGMIVETNEGEGEVLIQALKLNRRNGKMEYPMPFLFLQVPLRDVFCQVSDPLYHVTDDGVEFYTFAENEFDAVKASYRTFKAKRANKNN